MPTTLKMLRDHSQTLREIIGEMRSARVDSEGDEMAALLAEELSSPDSVQSVLEELRHEYPEVQTALGGLARAQGSLPKAQFTRTYGPLELGGEEQLLATEPWHNPRSLTEVLFFNGLIAEGFEGQGPDARRIIYIPSDILDQIPMGPEEESDSDVRVPYAAAPARREVLDSTDEFLNDVGSVIGCLAAAPLLLAGQDLAGPDAERLEERLLAPPDTPLLAVRRELLLHVVNRLELFKGERQENGQLLLALNRNRANDFLSLSRPDQRRRIWECWRASSSWDDLERVPALELHNRERWQHNPRAAREAFLRFCRSLQPTRWYAVEDVVAALQERQPDFQRPDGNYDDWYVRNLNAGRFARGFDDWDLVDGELARFLLLSPMAWLGALRVAETRGRHLVSLTRDGAIWHGARLAPAQAENQPRFVIHGDFSITVPLDLPLRQRMNIEQVARWQRSGGEYTYGISQRSLRHAFERGLGADRVLAALRNGSRGVPDRVERAIRKYAQQSEGS